MNKLGESASSAIKGLNGFFKDVSQVIKVVEEEMAKTQLTPLSSSSFWNQSTLYYLPGQWMPRWIVRHYVRNLGDNTKDEKNKPDSKTPWFAFFNVYLTPMKTKEPTAVWGVGTRTANDELWGFINEIQACDDGPDFLDEIPIIKEWKTIEVKQLSKFKYKAISITELTNTQEVKRIVTDPLVVEVKKLRVENC